MTTKDALTGLVLRPLRTAECTAFGRPLTTWVAGIAAGPPAGGLRVADALPEEELEQAAGMADPVSAGHFAAGRALLRTVLARRCGTTPRRLALHRDACGRPALAGAPGRHGLDFNLSHSGGYAALAVGRGIRVGVDLEALTARSHLDAIARRVFDPAEQELLRRAPQGRELQRWYRIWTTREALAKARGTGLRGISHAAPGHGSAWLRRELRVAHGYLGTVVALRPDKDRRL
ncbi:4'-phosphopantetheinyl transferase family protein [Streptacidiphilus griseoplanus]|uniref:4'-phosphopantetheinyl transferase family protein n=1 Tax=Peterkaempfera griseoplana TaxID=66896 RepID=UPI0006E3F4E7|nr:4'-phosphopantetheinyl transferase superfamily protein [Peterkaempfera griseoplana]BCN13457.1 4'-phosphopantetheinyl transferase [Peterkaempfera griseoplana]